MKLRLTPKLARLPLAAMTFRLHALTVLLLSTAEAGIATDFDLHKPVRIETGLIQGVPNLEGEVVAFKGIPYAVPPVGNLRWHEPEPPVHWEGIRQADKFGAPCVQPASPSGRPPPADMSEDCLFLNVWSPAKSATDKLSVLFFIHGGAGYFGSGNLNGENLAKKGIIVVSVNYRLGLFAGMGHPELTAESPHHACGNYGLLDLIAALKWVRTNITAFGGDPEKVTIAGQSSGACLGHYLTTSPVAKGLFRGAIAVSFPYDYLMKPNMIPFIKQKEENGVEFAKIKNAKSLADLRKIPALDFVANDPVVAKAKLKHLPSGVARDGWAFPWTYPDALNQGLKSDVPTMTGHTVDDFSPPAQYMTTTVALFNHTLSQLPETERNAILALGPVTTDAEAREMAKALAVENLMSPISSWAEKRANNGKTPAYIYLFKQAKPDLEHPEKGAAHGSDLTYEFNNLNTENLPWTKDDWQAADQVSSYWANFVKTGDPNGKDLPDWAAFNPNDPSIMVLDAQPRSSPIPAKEGLKPYLDLIRKK